MVGRVGCWAQGHFGLAGPPRGRRARSEGMIKSQKDQKPSARSEMSMVTVGKASNTCGRARWGGGGELAMRAVRWWCDGEGVV